MPAALPCAGDRASVRDHRWTRAGEESPIEKAASHGGYGMPPCATQDRGVIGCHMPESNVRPVMSIRIFRSPAKQTPFRRNRYIGRVVKARLHRLSAVAARTVRG